MKWLLESRVKEISTFSRWALIVVAERKYFDLMYSIDLNADAIAFGSAGDSVVADCSHGSRSGPSGSQPALPRRYLQSSGLTLQGFHSFKFIFLAIPPSSSFISMENLLTFVGISVETSSDVECPVTVKLL